MKNEQNFTETNSLAPGKFYEKIALQLLGRCVYFI